MWEYALGAASAFWLGILTSIGPCSLAMNVAAVSYIGRRVGNPRQVLITGLLYALGRTLAYGALGTILVSAALSDYQASLLLQKYMNKLLGPILILVAMVLLGLIRLGLAGSGLTERTQKRVDAWGIWGALLLGVIFALSFCPTSAALFFGSLIPLSLEIHSSVVMPVLYGIGTALPALMFAVLIALGAQSVGKAFDRLAQFERWARWITGVVFLAVGIHYSLRHIFEVL